MVFKGKKKKERVGVGGRGAGGPELRYDLVIVVRNMLQSG